MTTFAEKEFLRMNDVIVKCVQKYKAQQAGTSAVSLQKTTAYR